MKAFPSALSYELRYEPQVTGMVGTWTSQLVTGVKAPVTLSGVTPGTAYEFSARAMEKAGYSIGVTP